MPFPIVAAAIVAGRVAAPIIVRHASRAIARRAASPVARRTAISALRNAKLKGNLAVANTLFRIASTNTNLRRAVVIGLIAARSRFGRRSGARQLCNLAIRAIRPRGPYKHLKNSRSVGAGKNFTKAQKDKIIKENRRRNGGTFVRSDDRNDPCKFLFKPLKSVKGVKPHPCEWQIDHIIPKSRGGGNTFGNARVISRRYNRELSNRARRRKSQ